MNKAHPESVKVAVLDMYNNTPNQGMRCIKSLLESSYHGTATSLHYDVFETRYKEEVPALADYDIYICTGGPGSPLKEDALWEEKYFNLVQEAYAHNKQKGNSPKSFLFICHSFQMMCRQFEFGQVVPRKSQSFGILPVHKTGEGLHDPLFEGLPDPFYSADFREWQVIQPNIERLRAFGATIISLEKFRPHVLLERAVTGIRLSDDMVGVQFHPEADAEGMKYHFEKPNQKENIILSHGEEKYEDIIARLTNPDYIERTYKTVIPNFLRRSIERLTQHTTS